jgi:hypothetical protein
MRSRAVAQMLVTLALGAAGLAAPNTAAAASLTWSGPVTIDSANALSSVSCPSESLCVAVDREGNALSTGTPSSPGAPWTRVGIDAERSLAGVSCASASLCVAVDRHGRAFATNQPLGGGWSGRLIDPGTALTGVSCPTEALCVAVDEAGKVLVSTDPGSPGASWTEAAARGVALQGVSCTGAGCVAVDLAGDVLASSNGWLLHAVDASRNMTGISCITPLECVAVDATGNALASANSGAPAPTWSSTPIDAPGGLAGVSCASSGLCVAIGNHGEALASDDPTAAAPAWLVSSADGGEALTGVSCLASGFCAAVDAHGHATVGRVPPPSPIAAGPAEVTATNAVLSGFVDPHDATLLGCSFEYGTSSAYGQSVPCATLPSPNGGLQPVSAPIGGLEPNTTYHYRLLASSASGTSAGVDVTFTTAVSNGVALVFPHPSITGTPAVGQRLTCRPGVPSGSTAQLSYLWLRNLLPIPGATGSSYTVKGNDTGRHLQCQLTARNAGGSATARSAFVTVPVQGIPASSGETVVGRARASGSRLSVPVTCSAQSAAGCQIVLRVTVVETLRAGRVIALAARASSARRAAHAGALRHVTLSLGSLRARLARGQHATLSLRLNAAGRRLLAARHRVPVLVAVSGTVIGVIQSVLAERVVVVGAGTRVASRQGVARRR